MSEVIWKGFKLGDLFEFLSSSTIALKDYSLTDYKKDNSVEVVTSTKDNVNQYISKTDLPTSITVFCNELTINRNGSIGYCFYHEGEFIIPTGDTYVVSHLNEELKKTLDIKSNSFLSMIITHIFTSEIFGYNYKVNQERFERELIMLPCIEVGKDAEYIWEENGKKYTLAVNYISYLYLSGKVNYNQKLIENYTYNY